jgi:carbohydrate-selective porin OprB
MLFSAPRKPTRKRSAASLRLGAILCASISLHAADAAASDGPPDFGVTGGWGGLRARAEENGLTFELTNTLDWSSPTQGALDGRSTLRGLFDLRAVFAPPALGGGEFTVEYLTLHGRDAGADIGAFVAYSNIDTAPFAHWGELSYAQTLLDGALRVRLGQIDANTEFALAQASTEFLNSAAAYSPTIFTMRTYPDPALGANVFAQAGRVSLGLGAYGGTIRQSASFNRPFVIGEIGVTDDVLGRVAVGGWSDLAGFARFDGTTQSGTGGFYALAERRVWKKDPAAKDDARGASVFAQFGSASGAVSSIRQHFGLGVSATGLLPGRDADTCGVYVSVATLSRDDPTLTAAHEMAAEVFYGVSLAAFLKLKADVQIIRHPGGDITRRDAVIGTLRLGTTF